AKGVREITIGVNKAAEAPVDSDFMNAAVYVIDNLPAGDDREGRLLNIKYRGDVARLYCNGKLIDDNFYNGRPMLYGLWRLPEEATSLELRILPIQKDMPVYFPAEADTAPGEEVKEVTIQTFLP
ncbi:MAG: beta-galactosidase, partial [Muribaculaceae bacterium]|nr:beta-galactosidase [Muribaculaceae bacterium]